MTVEPFIEKWHHAQAAERSNAQSFLVDLCSVLGVAAPDPARRDPELDRYVFEKPIDVQTEDGGTSNFIDLYKAGCFVLEAKQGANESGLAGAGKRLSPNWHAAMNKARGQAIGYAKAFDPAPPFIIVCDVGYCLDLYAQFDGNGLWSPFPNAAQNRVFLKDLADEKKRQLLATIWTDPGSLDPTKRATRITREVAALLADLAKDLEASKHPPETVARFLMRCVFTMFAEDVGLLPPDLFRDRIEKEWLKDPAAFKTEVRGLWVAMDKGERFGFGGKLLRFNGGLFKNPVGLDLTKDQLKKLLLCARCDWSEVEPSIFGTLLERALSPEERHRLGAHYTPRAYVERLVRPTIEEPLREEWTAVQLLAGKAQKSGAAKELKAARKAVVEFHTKLVNTRVLDPACGTGNFLYVAFDLFKRLEGEVLKLERELTGEGETLGLDQLQISLKNFLGIEVKPWAKSIAELVLWIGYLQWHFRIRKNAKPEEPVLHDYGNIECRDAVLTWDDKVEAVDEHGKPLTRWDGVTFKKHPVTGQDVPDDSARIAVWKYVNPRPAEWPETEFVVGNPPFLGNFRMREALGDGYVEALRAAYDDVPESVDLVMYWWFKASQLARRRRVTRFGLVTTTSITQRFNRRVVESALDGKDKLGIVYATADHPWIGAKYGNTADGAEVRIAMSVGAAGGRRFGRLGVVQKESAGPDGEAIFELVERGGEINAELRVGAAASAAAPLVANSGLSCPGVKLHGSGFVLTSEQRDDLIRRGGATTSSVIAPYLNWQDVAARSRAGFVIDVSALEEDALRSRLPDVYQHLRETVWPEREHNKREIYRRRWWSFGEPRSSFRPALKGLPRYIGTGEASRRRFFVFIDGAVLPDNSMIAIASSDAFTLGVLSSRIHVTWALAAGGRLGIRQDPRYNKSSCFDPFPFPAALETAKTEIRALAEELDALRKQQQARHTDLTLSAVYGVLEAVRAGTPLDAKEKKVHEQGLVSVLKDIHDRLDAAVFAAYGWPADLTDEELIARLVALNAERAAEEKRGLVRWLRPEFQNPGGLKPQQVEADVEVDAEEDAPKKKVAESTWPKSVAERIAVVQAALGEGGAMGAAELAGRLGAKKVGEVVEILDGLADMGAVVGVGKGERRKWRVAGRRAA